MSDTEKTLICICIFIIFITLSIERTEDGITIGFGLLPFIKRLLTGK